MTDDLLVRSRGRLLDEMRSLNLENRPGMDDVVEVRSLAPKEALGDTGREDFPLLRGREVLVQAEFRGAIGQAYTSSPGDFKGSLEEALEIPIETAFQRGVMVSTMNAVLRHLGRIGGTVHCRDDGPRLCASQLKGWLRDQEAERVGLIGLQPAILEALVEVMGSERVMASDLAEAGKIRCGIRILDGPAAQEIFERCDLILATGSSLANGTIDEILRRAEDGERRVVFYGTTIAGASYLLGLERWCACST